MPRERAFWLVLGSMILIGLIAGLFARRGGDRPLALVAGAPKPIAQESRARTWRDVRFALVFQIPAGDSAALEQPTLLRTDSSGSLYILDSGEPQVLKVSDQGELLTRYEYSSMGSPTDVAVGSEGEVWVCDPERKAIAIFASDGRFLRRIVPHPPVARLAPSPRGGFVATGLTGGPGLFRRYSATGELLGSFGALFAEELHSSLAADGWIVTNGEFLVYPFRNAGLLVSYSVDGRLRFFRETITPVPLPNVHVDAAGLPSVDRNAPLASISGSIVGDELYVLSDAPDGRVLDVYETEHGTYRYSLHPPEKDARFLVVTADRLCSASRRGVTVWRQAGNSANRGASN